MTALLIVTALHAGFQAVVTVIVYPALAEVPEESWTAAHAAHSRRISYVVAPLYLALAVVGGAVLLGGDGSTGTWVALAGTAVAALTTAAVAAPAHGRLARDGRGPAVVRRLLAADRIRLAGSAVALGGAVAAVV